MAKMNMCLVATNRHSWWSCIKLDDATDKLQRASALEINIILYIGMHTRLVNTRANHYSYR